VRLVFKEELLFVGREYSAPVRAGDILEPVFDHRDTVHVTFLAKRRDLLKLEFRPDLTGQVWRPNLRCGAWPGPSPQSPIQGTVRGFTPYRPGRPKMLHALRTN
jgi:hypothetical protein